MSGPRCADCPGREKNFYPVPSDGPRPCPVLALGAGPGQHDSRVGRCYVGQVGEELDNTYLPIAGLRRGHSVHVGNCCLCWDGMPKAPPEGRVRTCGKFHLPALLAKVQPQVVILMGAATCKIADRRIRLDMHRGRPFWGSILDGEWEGWIWPSFETGLGIRDTERMTPMLEDWRHFGEWMRGEWVPPSPPEEVRKDYALVSSLDDLRRYTSLYQRHTISIDTETHGPDLWSLQFSLAPHTGRMILTKEQAVLEMLQDWLEGWEAEALLHNAGQDLDVLERMGIRPVRFRDTMQEAYHQCSLPQGLKALAYRLLGVTMRSWEDVVWPASIRAACGWMADAILLAQEGMTEITVTKFKYGRCIVCGHQHTKGKCKNKNKRTGVVCTCDVIGQVSHDKYEREPSAVEAVLSHILTYTTKTEDADKPYDPWKALPEMKVEGLRGKVPEPWMWEVIEEQLGPMPILGIGNCEMGEAVEYGCSDADHTGQVAEILEQGKTDPRWDVDPVDWNVEVRASQ